MNANNTGPRAICEAYRQLMYNCNLSKLRQPDTFFQSKEKSYSICCIRYSVLTAMKIENISNNGKPKPRTTQPLIPRFFNPVKFVPNILQFVFRVIA